METVGLKDRIIKSLRFFDLTETPEGGSEKLSMTKVTAAGAALVNLSTLVAQSISDHPNVFMMIGTNASHALAAINRQVKRYMEK